MIPHHICVAYTDDTQTVYQASDPQGNRLSGGALLCRTIHFGGKELPAGAVGGVGTEPECRREGLVREIFSEMAKECDRRAIPLTILHPFSFAYYRKFGFERVADHRILEFPITALNFVPRYSDLIRCHGKERDAELAYVYHTFAAAGRHLLPRRSEGDGFHTEEADKRVYLSRDDAGVPDGYLVLELEHYFSVNRMVSVNLHVHEMAFTTSEALLKLLGFLRMFEGEMDTVKLHNTAMMPEVELRLRHYIHTKITVIPDLMARINDVKAFFEAVPYPAEAGQFTVKVTEPTASPWSGERTEGVWRIDYKDGQAKVLRLEDNADYDFAADVPALTQMAFGYESYGYETARYTENTQFRNPVPDFFRAFPRRAGGIFEHF